MTSTPAAGEDLVRASSTKLYSGSVSTEENGTNIVALDSTPPEEANTVEEEVLEEHVEVTALEEEAEDVEVTPTVTTSTMKGSLRDVVGLTMVDHFSLRQPSSTVRFRTKTIQVYDLVNDQLQLEHKITEEEKEKPTLQVTMMRTRSGSMGLRFLRSIYTLAALLMLGMYLIFTTQLVSFQCMEIPGSISGEGDIRYDIMVATIFSLPLIAYSMASLMVLAVVFVADVWNGHVLYALLMPHSYTARSRVAVEWFCFVVYIVVPVMVTAVSMFLEADNWQEIFGLSCLACINFSFWVFCALVFYQEMALTRHITRLYHPELSGGAVMKQALLITLQQGYCAVQENTYLIQNGQDDDGILDTDKTEPIKTRISWMGRLKILACCGVFYDPIDPPIRRYSVAEMRESVPYVTNTSWGLEKLCCKLRNGRSRFVVVGQNALQPHQYKSTLVCNVFGFCLALVAIAALIFTFLGGGLVIIIIIAVVLVAIVGLPLFVSAKQLYNAMPQDEEEALRKSTAGALYQAWAAFTIAKPKDWVSWTRLGFCIVALFVYPCISMYVNALPKNATVFLITGLFSGFRLYLDAGSILKEHGSISSLTFTNDQDDADLSETKRKAKDMVSRARAGEIIGKVTHSARTWLWMLLYICIAIYFIWAAANSQDGETWEPQPNRPPIVMLNDFYYEAQTDISYPICELTKEYKIPGMNHTYMMDYNMLAGLGYETTNVTDYVLDRWFKEEDSWIDETPFVTQWKKDNGHEESPVSYKLFTKSSEPGVGILSVRGTETATDALFNPQLYQGAFLIHFIRGLIPFNWLWQPVYDNVVGIASWVMSDQLFKASYYLETTEFANDMLNNNYTFEGKNYNFYYLRTTGVSLGGGIALITGAQTDAYGFAISGINPVLSRLVYEPNLSMEDLNTRVMNVIPETDFISNMGDKVRNHQTVRCRTWPAEIYNCHSFWRVLCESLYSCGSPPDRPGVLCKCVQDWGYPVPKKVPGTGNKTFEERCYEEELIFNETTGMEYVTEYSD